jgi:phenylpropionate dioxygenase-like ring-hydroxylating dioxygenase large terminal subunit
MIASAMDPEALSIDPDIRKARTLAAEVYTSPWWFELARERVFARTWHLVADASTLHSPGRCAPVLLLEGLLDEPLLLTRDRAGLLRCLSNVCTHRGNRVCEEAGHADGLRCRYHGRRFGLDGRFLSMPEFEGVADFPTAADDLPAVPHAAWHQFLFASVRPESSCEELLAPVESRIGWLPIDRAKLDEERSRNYEVNANWALYCDNYLEGFHIPFVHHGLTETLEFGKYRTELFPHGTLQIGIAREGESALAPPRGSPESGERVGGYYFWLFPATMINVYPWGISFNVVKPLAADRTRVSFLTYVWDPSKLDRGAGSDLDRVEQEDEAVVQSVQTGVRSRFYRGGRYSPSQERGVHHFHRLLVELLRRGG